MSPDRDRTAMLDILESFRTIQIYTESGQRRFFEETMVQDAVNRRFEVAGEAARRLSQAFRDKHPQVPWKQVIGFRDVLIHGYERIDFEEVWSAATETLPPLVKALESIRRSSGWN